MSAQNRYETQHTVLDPVKLMAEARAAAGLSDFGDTRFVASMTRLLDRAAREVDFSAEGLAGFRADNIRLLVNRLRTREDIQRHPEILREDVSDPIIVIGLPRSGTTKMQRILAAAPNMQKLFLWRMLNPARFPNAIPGQRDPRMAAAGMGSGEDSAPVDGNQALQADEALKVAHELAAGQVEEEFFLFDFPFDESVAGFNPYIPLFRHQDWVMGKEREADLDAYRYFRMLLQYLQWQDGGKRGRPWVLKTVFHIAHLDALLECFPRATLVHCHRDPLDATPSLAKLMWTIQSMKANVDKEFTGHEFLKWGAAAMDRCLEARERLHLNDRILDAKYENIRDDVMPIIREVYRRAEWELTAEAEQAMRQWEQGNEQGKHGKHSYSLQEFGLTEDMINLAFAQYIRRFIDR